MSIDIRVIRAEPHVEIGTLIQRDSNILVERWCRRALAEQPNAKRVHYEVLRDQLPTFLKAMGRSLVQSGNADARQHCESAFEHGDQRWDNGWSLGELVRDYQILQLVILEYLEETLQRPLRYREVMAVGVFLDDATAASIAKYVANREEQVRQAEQKRAEALQEANRRKDEFLAMLAHELRNPLAPIQNSTKVLQMLLPTTNPALGQALDVVERQTRQLVRLVDDLLDLARIAQGRFELRKKPINLVPLLEQAIQQSEPVLKARDHQLTVKLPTDPLHMEADPARLVQIIVNLLHNAAKYTDRGGQISLTAQPEGDEAVIRVRDNGIGIPPEMLSRIFDLFTQTEGSRGRSQGGLGIGLTLVQRLVEQQGGTVTCHSPGVGQGSEFIIRLPMHAVVTPSSLLRPVLEAPVAKSCHLLIVEDHADARDSLAMLLNLLGHRVEVAENGTRGIEKALASQPQVALIDIGLPDVNGYEVAQQLRAKLGDRIFLIALTGYGQTDDLRQALDAGFDAHLLKPAELGELARLLERVTSDQQ
jgi:signal transduction histidine kinase/CheY-like chemotaxis protein